MPSVIDRASGTLTARNVPHTVDGDEIVVPPGSADGFVVVLRMVTDRAYRVRYDGWHHEFDRAEDAYDCFEYGLSDSCRLKVVYRGDRPIVWQVEKREFGLWAPSRPVRERSWAFWKPTRIEYRQNHVFTRIGDEVP